MKLLSKASANEKIQKDNEELIETNVRLRGFWQQITKRLNDAKADYSPDKLKALKEFELFVKDIDVKKSNLLKELNSIEKAIKERKDIYYGFIEKQDNLEERVYNLLEGEKKLKLREEFVIDLEHKWRAKQ